jgi:hydroxypyruvate isomerase
MLSSLKAAAAPQGPFAGAKLRMSAPIDWFPGGSSEQKLEAVAKWGLSAYEWLNPKGDLKSLRKKADSLGLELSCIVGAGQIAPGHMVAEDQHDKVVQMFEDRVKMAKDLNCRHLIGLTGNERTDISRDQQTELVIKCLKRLAPIAEKNDVLIVMEALNPFVDHEGFFLNRTDHTMQILKAVGSPNVKMCFDIYHQQITEGNVIRNLTENIDYIGHFHVADNPGRKEPGTGELNYKNIFKAIAGTNYKEFVALECGHSTKKYEDTLKATLDCLNFA